MIALLRDQIVKIGKKCKCFKITKLFNHSDPKIGDAHFKHEAYQSIIGIRVNIGVLGRCELRISDQYRRKGWLGVYGNG